MTNVKTELEPRGARALHAAAFCIDPLALRPEAQMDAERRLTDATRAGDIPAARRMADCLIRMDPDSPAYHFNKGLLCQHQSEIEQAVYEFMHTILLDPEGPYADPSRCFLEDLDLLQLHQIAILANEDLVFRTKLSRNSGMAAMERGFALSPVGEQRLREYCDSDLAEADTPPRASRYH